MPKLTKSGTGMMERQGLSYEMRAGEDEWRACVEDLMQWPGPAESRARKAETCWQILAIIGIHDTGSGVDYRKLLESRVSEDSAQWLAALWLIAHGRWQRAVADISAGSATPETIEWITTQAETMAKLWERMWWRAGIDPQTGKRPEELALGKRAQETALPKAIEARRIQAQDTKPDWHDSATQDAIEIRRKHPSYSRWRIAGEIHEKFGVSQGRCDKVLRANGVE